MATNESWQPSQSLGGLISSLSYKMRKQTKLDLAKADLAHISFARFWVLHHLNQFSHNQASLCKILDQRPPSMMEMLNRLKDDGLVKYKAQASDPRKKDWSLTAKGKRDYHQAKEVVRDVGRRIDQFFARVNIEQVEVENAKKILSMLDNDHFKRELQ